MTEFNYPECTTSVITALAIFRKHYPTYRRDDIQYVSSDGFAYHIPTHTSQSSHDKGGQLRA